MKPGTGERFTDLELVNLLVCRSLYPAEKQALLEAAMLKDREKVLWIYSGSAAVPTIRVPTSHRARLISAHRQLNPLAQRHSKSSHRQLIEHFDNPFQSQR